MLKTYTIQDPVDSTDAFSGQKHQVTDIKEALRDQNRVNIFVNQKFYCSLDIAQVVDLGVKIGRIYDSDALKELKRASEFGKLYARVLEYIFSRPHSIKEVKDYLKRKTLARTLRRRNRQTGQYESYRKEGYDPSLVPLVLDRLDSRGYLDDTKFAKFWVENHNRRKGSSLKKLRLELQQKGVSSEIIEQCLVDSERTDVAELHKLATKRMRRCKDREKLIGYLLRQGFNYSDILDELSSSSIGE